MLAIVLSDPAAVASQAGGALGTVGNIVLPGYTTAQVYQGVIDALARQGVAATVVNVPDDAESADLGVGARDLAPLLVGAILGYVVAK